MSQVNEDNFLDALDALDTMELLDLVATMLGDFAAEHETFDPYILEKPWKYPEIWVPALNGDLYGRVTECMLSSMVEEY